jgi:hypothetical protein
MIEGAIMKLKHSFLLCAAISALSIAACSDSQKTAAPQPPVTQSLDSAQVLALARSSSETSAPFQVDYGLVTFSDTSETSAPIAVNGP